MKRPWIIAASALAALAGFGAARIIVTPEYQPVAASAAYRLPHALTPQKPDEGAPQLRKPRSEKMPQEPAALRAKDYQKSPPDDTDGSIAAQIANALGRESFEAVVAWALALPEGSRAREQSLQAATWSFRHHYGTAEPSDYCRAIELHAPEELRGALVAEFLQHSLFRQSEDGRQERSEVREWLGTPTGSEAYPTISSGLSLYLFGDVNHSREIERALGKEFTRDALFRGLPRFDTVGTTSAVFDWLSRQDDPLTMLALEHESLSDRFHDNPEHAMATALASAEPRRRGYLLEELVAKIRHPEALVFDGQAEHSISPWLAAQADDMRAEFAATYLRVHGSKLPQETKTALTLLVEHPSVALKALR